MAWVLVCDSCGEKIPKIKKKNAFGDEIEVYDTGEINEPFPNTSDIMGLKLCKPCALKVENEILRGKIELIEKYGVVIPQKWKS